MQNLGFEMEIPVSTSTLKTSFSTAELKKRANNYNAISMHPQKCIWNDIKTSQQSKTLLTKS